MNQKPQNEAEEAQVANAQSRARRLIERIQTTCGQRSASLAAAAVMSVMVAFLEEHECEQCAVEALDIALGKL